MGGIPIHLAVLELRDHHAKMNHTRCSYINVHDTHAGVIIDRWFFRRKPDMFQYFSTVLYVHFGNSREEKSTSGVGNLCVPSLLLLTL